MLFILFYFVPFTTTNLYGNLYNIFKEMYFSVLS